MTRLDSGIARMEYLRLLPMPLNSLLLLVPTGGLRLLLLVPAGGLLLVGFRAINSPIWWWDLHQISRIFNKQKC